MLSVLLFCQVMQTYASGFSKLDLFVDPLKGDDTALGTMMIPLRTMHAARDRIRDLRASHSVNKHAVITVNLLPGTHHITDEPLTLGPLDGGVTWRSVDKSNPAVVGAPIRVTGWHPHPKVQGAMAASLPKSIAKGSPLRQFWVNGQRAERPKVFGHGRQQGDNRNGHCLNLTNASATKMFPEGSLFDFTHENATDPSKWPNPGDVEFVYTSCDAINCWIEPRCTVDTVHGNLVGLKGWDGADNSSCYHRLYYYGKCFNNGKGPEQRSRGRYPTHLENVGTNWTQPGQFYYDRANALIGYIPRDGETAATLEATATTATKQLLLVVNNSHHLVWDSVQFSFASWLGVMGPKGYVDTQSAYLCLDGEPPVNIRVQTSTDITFKNCGFEHLGGVYALGVDGGSQSVVVSNNSFTDVSGGGVKLGFSGERGAKAPNVTLDPKLQDRGFLVSDNLFVGIPREYSGANPIFAGYVADTVLEHNTIHDSRYTGICVGWGWGMDSYMRNVHVQYNHISMPMQLLADGGGVYTNTPCPGCTVSSNYMEGDPNVYGCLYHDGGSSLWTDKNNVFNNVSTSAAFCHGSCPGITISPLFYNNSGGPNLQGATNSRIHDSEGVCVPGTAVKLQPGQQWSSVPAQVVANAGRRTKGPLPPLTPPPLSPPVNTTQNRLDTQACIKFAARKCDASKQSQRWILTAKGVKPGDGQTTNVKSAVKHNASCWQANNCGYGPAITSDAATNNDYVPVKYPEGCKPLPDPKNTTDKCRFSQAFQFNANGTIALSLRQTDRGQPMHHCLQIQNGQVMLGNCYTAAAHPHPDQPKQIWTVHTNPDHTITIEQDGLCVDNNWRPVPLPAA